MQWEAARAMLSLAGIRQLKQATVAPGASANASYTVTEAATRRIVAIHLGTANGDIRFNYNAASTATSLPMPTGSFLIIDVQKDDTVQFFNTSGGALTVNLMEIE